MSEVQKHGFDFEDWVKKIVFKIDDPNSKYTDKWDIDTMVLDNKIPVSVKLMGEKNAVEFSSALRMWKNTEEFILILGRWKQVNKNTKKITSIDEINITKDILDKFKGQITLEEITEFDKKIKSFPHGKDGQKNGIIFAKKWKNDRKEKMGLLTITHKIDSKDQRRVQCSLNYTNYLKLFGSPSMKNELRGYIFNENIESSPRVFNKN